MNLLVHEEISASGLTDPLDVVDLGCGVGGTIFQLADLFPRSRLHGVTISRKQHRLASSFAERRGLDARCRFTLGDFHDVEPELEADVVVAIESFVHSRSPAGFVAAAARHMKEDALLIVVDDFLTRAPPEPDPVLARRIEEFRAGWHLPSLCTLEALTAAGRAVELETLRTRDLTPLIRIRRPTDRLVRSVATFLRALNLTSGPLLSSLVAGDALNAALAAGAIRYRLVVLRKAGVSGPDDPTSPSGDRAPG